MRKITLGFFVIVVAMLFIVGCSDFGAVGNPTVLTGTWTGSQSDNGQSLAGAAEGTWVLHDFTYPTPTSSVTSLGGVTTTTYYSNTTVEVLDTSVVAADGSSVETIVTTTSDAARAAIPAVNTATAFNIFYAEILVGSKTTTQVFARTPTLNIDGTYQVRTVMTYSGLATGSSIGDSDGVLGTNLTAVSQSISTDDTQSNVTNPFIPTLGIDAVQTVKAASGGLADSAYSLVITEEGTYTKTTTTTTTVTVPSAGTTVATTVETGTVLGSGSGDGANDWLTFNKASTATTYVGTGSLISVAYPATAFTITSDNANTTTWSYYVTKGGSDTFLQIYTIIGGSWPTLTLSN